MPGSENEVCHWGCYLVYDYLFYYDEDNNPFSDILKEWHYEEDGTTFVMECRDDVDVYKRQDIQIAGMQRVYKKNRRQLI